MILQVIYQVIGINNKIWLIVYECLCKYMYQLANLFPYMA